MSINKEHYITPCPVCGLEDECPHTPIRCEHNWKYETAGLGGQPLAPGEHRTCLYCERVERAKFTWETVKA